MSSLCTKSPITTKLLCDVVYQAWDFIHTGRALCRWKSTHRRLFIRYLCIIYISTWKTKVHQKWHFWVEGMEHWAGMVTSHQQLEMNSFFFSPSLSPSFLSSFLSFWLSSWLSLLLFDAGSHYVALELTLLILSGLSECWEHRHVPPCPARAELSMSV